MLIKIGFQFQTTVTLMISFVLTWWIIHEFKKMLHDDLHDGVSIFIVDLTLPLKFEGFDYFLSLPPSF